MSHRLRPLRLFVLCCAAAAIAAPVSASSPPIRRASPAPGPTLPPPSARRARPRKAGPGRGSPADQGPVVATVNGQPIRLSELEVAQQSLPQQYRNMPLQAVFPALLDRIIDSKLVVQEGKKSKVTEDPAFKKRMAFVEDQVLQDFWIQREIARQVTADKLQKRYEERLKQMPTEEEGARPAHPGIDRGRGQGGDRRDQEGRRFRQARQGKVDRQGVRRRGRRPRLVQEVGHGEGVRRRRLQPEEGRRRPRRRSRPSSATTSSRSRTAARRRRRPSRRWPTS